MSQHIDAVAKQSGLDVLNSNFSTKNPTTVAEFKSLVASIPSSKHVSFVAPAVVSEYITGYTGSSVSGIITRINASIADIIWTTNSGMSSGSSRYAVNTDTITINDLSNIKEFNGTDLHSSISSISVKKNIHTVTIMIMSKDVSEGVDIKVGNVLGKIDRSCVSGSALIIPVYIYNNGKLINGTIWTTSSGSLIYYGEDITQKIIAMGTYVIER